MQVVFDYTRPQYTGTIFRRASGQPDIVEVEPVNRGGSRVSEEAVFGEIASTLRAYVILALREYNQLWTGQRLNSKVTGILQMINLNSVQKHAHTTNLKPKNITIDAIREIFDRATTGYLSDLSIYDVKFTYWINPNSFKSGSGNGSKTWAKKTRGIYDKSYRVPKGEYILNCAASAIVYNLCAQNYYSPTSSTHISNNKYMYGKTLQLMKDLEWDDEVSLAELEDFVDFMPDYRIVIINGLLMNGSSQYKGEDYVFDGHKKIVHVYYDFKLEHFYAVSAPKEFIRGQKGNDCDWCYECGTFFRGPYCTCYNGERKPSLHSINFCNLCGASYAAGKHTCFATKCEVCRMPKRPGHRCTIFGGLGVVQKRFIGEVIDYQDIVPRDKSKKPAYNLIAYDIESALVYTEKMIPSYQTDDDGCFLIEHQIIEVNQAKQIPNLVCWENVFTGEKGHFYDIKEFVLYMLNVNDGYNILVAHNSKGYDGRLIFDAICRINTKLEYHPLMRGTQMIQLKCGNTIFRDSLLHLPGSLSVLANDCLKESGIDLEKGEYPHFFNHSSKRGYVGPLPDDKYYDLKFTLKDKKGIEKHKRFRAKWEGREDWDADKMLLEYCQNDVTILSALMKYHHNNCKNAVRSYEPRIAVSPWFSVTSAGYVHRITLLEQKLNLEDNEDISNEWVSLDPVEHYFAKKALRGGRTEVRKFYHKAVDGEKIKCIDVHSMYPSIQIGKSIAVDGKEYPLLFPVGAPIIEVFDTKYFPCTGEHFANPSNSCNCSDSYKQMTLHKNVEVVVKDSNIDIHEYLRNFDGIIMIDAIPPKGMYHPILPVFDEITKKCVFSCERITRKIFPSPLLKVAIDHGYIVTKIYRADRYRMAESKWRGLLGNMYKLKYYSSSNGDKTMAGETVDEMQRRHIAHYKEKFDLDIDFSNCRKDPAMKQTGKILINSAWGKHAESIDHDMAKIIDEGDDRGNHLFYGRISNEEIHVKEYLKVGDRTMFKYNETRNNDTKSKPNLHKQYLPAAVFVPMYGQMMMWNMLNKVGEAALMCDTDSVKYVSKDVYGDGCDRIRQYLYSNGREQEIIPGDCLGDWEDEGNLEEFVSIGLKSYALRYEGKSHEWDSKHIKLKGCCIKYSHKNLINFDTMKDVLINGKIINLPQLSFDYQIGEGIMTREFLKKVKFDAKILKGNYDPKTFKLYPFNY